MPAHSRSPLRRVPEFSLYGEQRLTSAATDVLHIEDIPSRSRKYLWKISTHRHLGLCQCVYVTAGAAAVTLDEQQLACKGRALIVIPAGTVHAFRFREGTRGYVLTVDLKRLLTLAPALHQAPIEAVFSLPRSIDLEANAALGARLEPLFASLLREFREPDSLTAPSCAWLACALLWTVAADRRAGASADAAAGPDLERLRRLRTAIEQNFLRHWPVSRYAKQLGLSEGSLNRLCRRLTGSTAFELVQQRLALEARRRLIYVAGSVAAIAGELGFPDPAYFCRFFRRHTGASPSAFRRRHAGPRSDG